MTRNQLEHLQEQREAAQHEFYRMWQEVAVPCLVDLHVPQRVWWAVEHCCWRMFQNQRKKNQHDKTDQAGD